MNYEYLYTFTLYENLTYNNMYICVFFRFFYNPNNKNSETDDISANTVEHCLMLMAPLGAKTGELVGDISVISGTVALAPVKMMI
jgi:hypothetical protein